MKNRIKYVIGTLAFASLAYYSAINERYHILIPIIMGVMCLISLGCLLMDRKQY